MAHAIHDYRTEFEQMTHDVGVVGTDHHLLDYKGIGSVGVPAFNYAVWACTPSQLTACKRYVQGRSDMTRVRVVERLQDYRPRVASTHIYVYKPEVHG